MSFCIDMTASEPNKRRPSQYVGLLVISIRRLYLRHDAYKSGCVVCRRPDGMHCIGVCTVNERYYFHISASGRASFKTCRHYVSKRHLDHMQPGIHTGDRVEFNTVDFVESRLFLKPATNRKQSQLLPYRVDVVARMLNVLSTLSPMCTGPKQRGRLCPLSTKSTVLNSTLSLVCTGLNSGVNVFEYSNV